MHFDICVAHIEGMIRCESLFCPKWTDNSHFFKILINGYWHVWCFRLMHCKFLSPTWAGARLFFFVHWFFPKEHLRLLCYEFIFITTQGNTFARGKVYVEGFICDLFMITTVSWKVFHPAISHTQAWIFKRDHHRVALYARHAVMN